MQSWSRMQHHSCIVPGFSGADVGRSNQRDPWVAVPRRKQGSRNVVATAPSQQIAAWLEQFQESHGPVETPALRAQQLTGSTIGSQQPLLAVQGQEYASV